MLVNDLLAQKKIYATDGMTLKLSVSEVDQLLCEKFPAQHNSSSSMKITTEFATLLMVEYSKLDSESYINSFTFLKPSQILQIMEVLRPDKNSRKPVPGSVIKLLQCMAKSEEKSNLDPLSWHLSDEFNKH